MGFSFKLVELVELIIRLCISVPAQVREEPEKIKKWREDQKTRLEEKDREEEKKKEELREQAKKELEDWYKHHEETISKTKSSNRYILYIPYHEFIWHDKLCRSQNQWVIS